MSNTALALALRGYVVFSMDLDMHGKSGKPKAPRVPFGTPYPNGKGTMDGLKYLQSLDIVDTENVGMIGMSMGGIAIDAAAQFFPDSYSALFFMGSGCDGSCPKLKIFAIGVDRHIEIPPNFRAKNGIEIIKPLRLTGNLLWMMPV